MNAEQRYNDAVRRSFVCLDATLLTAPEQTRGEMFAVRKLLQDALQDENHPLLVIVEPEHDPQSFVRYGELALDALSDLQVATRQKKVSKLLGATRDWLQQILGKGTRCVESVYSNESDTPEQDTYTVINDDGRRTVEFAEEQKQAA